MPLGEFQSSPSLTMGVELELQLLNLSDFSLIAASDDLLALLQRRPFPGVVTQEITQGMIEVATSVHTRCDMLLDELQQIRDTLVRAGDRLNIGIGGGGIHPFQTWPDHRITGQARYRQVSALYGYLAKQFTVFGQHVHIGCRNGDEALYLLHALGPYVPHFIALSASSPFSHGHDTLFDSSRLNSVFAFPLSGRAPFILDWKNFADDYFVKMEHTGVVRGMKDFYWDIRPKPEYGTIELRVSDTPLTVTHAATLACYLQALCYCLLEQREQHRPAEDDYLVYNYNRFQACRFGLDGVVVDPRTYAQRPLRDDIEATLRRMTPALQALGSEAMMAGIQCVLDEGNHASYLRHLYAQQGSLEGVAEQAVRRFRTG